MVSNNKFSKFLIFFFIFIFILNSIAIKFFLYWRFLWFDNVMHFLGGAGFGFFAIWFFYYSGKIFIQNLPKYFLLMAVLASAALGGVLWELYEFTLDVFVAQKGYLELSQAGVADTMSDLFFDLMGAASTALLFLFKKKKKEL